MSDTAEVKYKYDKTLRSWVGRHRDVNWETKHLEVLVVLEALSELPRVGRNWAAVAYSKRKKYRRGKSEYTTVLNKYNTNYEALGWLTNCISF